MNATALLSRFRRTRPSCPIARTAGTGNHPSIPVPSEIVLPMQQRAIGALCEPVVKRRGPRGRGQPRQARAAGLSADIFSGVSGTVKAIQPVFYSTGKTDTTVIIQSDGAQTVSFGGTPG